MGIAGTTFGAVFSRCTRGNGETINGALTRQFRSGTPCSRAYANCHQTTFHLTCDECRWWL